VFSGIELNVFIGMTTTSNVHSTLQGCKWIMRVSESESSQQSGGNMELTKRYLLAGRRLALLLGIVLIACACVEKPKPKPRPPAGPLHVANSGFPAAVDAVLKHKCRRCHTTPLANSAPFPLLTWDDTRKLRYNRPIWMFIGTAVKSGFMPYRVPLTPPVERLTETEKATLLSWVDAGAANDRGSFGEGTGGAGGAGGARPVATPAP